MKKLVFGSNEYIVGEGYSLLRVWRRLSRTCWTRYSEEPRINPTKIYAIHVLQPGEGQSKDYPELEWLSSSQLVAEIADL